MDKGTRFIIREGTRTVGAGKVIYCPETDQRGVESSIDGDSNNRANCDIGAYEFTQGEPFIVIINDTVTQMTDGDFEVQVLQADLPTLVVFGAPSFGPCKAIEPVIQELAGEYDGKIKVYKMNVDENPATPGKYGIRAIPTAILFKGGQVVDQVVGAAGKSQLVALIDKAL